MALTRSPFGLVARVDVHDARLLDAAETALQRAYPARRVEAGGGFVFVHPCGSCKHTRCGDSCGCDCNRATVRP
jgi:hypothetical protein